MGNVRRGVVAVGSALALAGCWGVPGQNADRTAFNGVESTITPATVNRLTPAWTYDGGPVSQTVHPGMGDPVVSGSSVFAVTGGCFVHGINAATGQERWTTPANSYCDPAVFDTLVQDPVQESSPPFVDGDRLLLGQFVVDPDPQPPSFPFPVYFQEALDAATGARLADSAPGTMPADIRGRAGVGSSPYVAESTFQGLPIFGGAWANGIATVGSLDSTDDHKTIKLMNGSGVSKLPLLGPSWVVTAGTGVATTAPGDATLGPAVRIYGLAALAAGNTDVCGPAASPLTCPQFIAPLPADAATNPVESPDFSTVYEGAADGSVLAVDTGNGQTDWTASVGATPSATPALAAGVLYVATSDGRLVALDAESGATLWSASVGSSIDVQPAVAGGVVYTGSHGGTVDAFAASGCGASICDPLWSHDVGAAITGAPAVSAGQLYVATADNRLIAFHLG